MYSAERFQTLKFNKIYKELFAYLGKISVDPYALLTGEESLFEGHAVRNEERTHPGTNSN